MGKKLTIILTYGLLMIIILGGLSCLKAKKQELGGINSEQDIFDPARLKLEDNWGIKVLGIRLSAEGYILDFRYKVLDPDKVLFADCSDIKPYLIDQISGARFYVPSAPKTGPLHQLAAKPKSDHNYFILFANPGRFVKAGNRVTVAVGEFEIQDLIVE